ncbi:MAG: hypothetical protein M1547_02105 [Gammaproteobacteria bacterium]|nr:hypothetical protein [Gammaproteobacteria bacterium]
MSEIALRIVLIGFAGARLTRHGDVIAGKTGMGGAWAGLALAANGALGDATIDAPC